jgi:hypothetical protein
LRFKLKSGIKNKYQNTSGAGSSPQSSSGGFTTVTPLDNVDYYDDVRTDHPELCATVKQRNRAATIKNTNEHKSFPGF